MPRPLPEGDLQRSRSARLTALTAIHGAGVVHRDFKRLTSCSGPTARGRRLRIARLTDASTITSGLIGTPSHVAPEQLAGARPTSAVEHLRVGGDHLIYAATGRLAFGADSVSAVMHAILYEEPDGERPAAVAAARRRPVPGQGSGTAASGP